MQTLFLGQSDLKLAAALIKAGKLVAFPTETVYGLGASVFCLEAIASIFQVKGRPSDNPLIVHIGSLDQVSTVARDIPAVFNQLSAHFWPGPLTFVLKRNTQIPSLVSAGLDSIAVRMPSHPIALELIRQVKEPLVAPSANLSGKPSPTNASHVLEDFEGKISAVIEGGSSEFGIESTVISLLGEVPLLLRPGSIRRDELEAVLGYPILVADPVSKEPVLSPGMKYRHYAPRCPIFLFETQDQLMHQLKSSLSSKKMVLSSNSLPISLEGVDSYSLCSKNFYALLRRSDLEQYQEILVLCDANLRQDPALMNRLMKAAQD